MSDPNGDKESAGSVAPDGGQPENSSSADASSSSSEDEAGYASPPPNKRRKYASHTYSDPRVDSLIAQVSYISNFVCQLSNNTLNTNLHHTSNNNLSGPSQAAHSSKADTQFLNNPFSQSNNLTLGEINIDFDEKKIIPPANKERLVELENLQKFNTQAWKGIRYKKAMQSYTATPGFVGLKINDELCHYNNSKDYLASTEQLLASLSNAVLEHRQLLQNGLQSIIDWASVDSKNLNVSSLFEKFSSTFGPGSDVSKNSEISMQIICGKRAECIEVRRDRILKELANPNLRATLQNIPPDSEYLFSKATLQPIIQSLGGSQTWLSTPSYLKEKKINSSYEQQHTYKKHQKFSSTKSYRNEKNENKSKFVPKKNQPFRRNNQTGNNSSSHKKPK